jgi:exosortase
VNLKGKALSNHIGMHRYPYLLLAVIFLTNIPVFEALIADWLYDDNYSHGFLVIPIAIFLIWRKRKELIFPARPSGWGIFLFGLGCLSLILGNAASELFTTRVSILMVITGISLYHLGVDNFKIVWFAFFFLLFMIPIPATIYYSATLPMQLFASKMTNNLLHLIGVPSVRQGNIIFLPKYTLEVVDACSGLRSLVSLMALAGLYGYLTLIGKVKPTILFFAAIPIAIAANIFRLLVTAVGAYAISTRLADNFLHEISGLIVFLSALIVIIALGAILKCRKKRLS